MDTLEFCKKNFGLENIIFVIYNLKYEVIWCQDINIFKTTVEWVAYWPWNTGDVGSNPGTGRNTVARMTT